MAPRSDGAAAAARGRGLVVEDIRRRFGGVVAVDGVSFSCGPSERLAIIGPNGAGKSTLFGLISGFIKLDSGRVWFGGESLSGLAPHVICQKGVARTFQVTQAFSGLTVEENVRAAALLRASDVHATRSAAKWVLERFQLTHVAKRPSASVNVPDRKRLELARAYATRPKLLLLDEIGAGLTPADEAKLVDLLRDLNESEGIGIIFVEHVMGIVESLAQRIAVLTNGRIIATGSVVEIAANPDVMAAYLGTSRLDARSN